MKKMIFVLITMGSTFAMAFPSAAEMRHNYRTCASQGAWHQRFGQYLASFSLNEAVRICRAEDGVAKLMGCKINGHYQYAGYYCQPHPGTI